MDDLLKLLKAYKALYKGDPEGLNSDFELVTGFSILELTDLIQDEIDQHRAN